MFSEIFRGRAHCSLEDERTDELHACIIGAKTSQTSTPYLANGLNDEGKSVKTENKVPQLQDGPRDAEGGT
jgi:hypothetical protein